ncbi:Glycosyltransferase involved in cell wall bisynthesis [Lacrimispora sphenoides]|jgi:glycosyltransferase involved in cell wall biosynthesis|uniref:glycosyltransferase family 4 protein n=1 Tax=Lacrimispora sphenoides TaxID=29370 RepID=UPI0008C5BB22|nr:glycosyltransferase family 4 protein [Lacrimispora sphenoides]SET94917.1 Glycosyltransferase involved in cell wall bisynthesis [Lacrimispora sphenoides]
MVTNVIIFGTGLFYSRRKDTLPEQTNIIAFIDNNIAIQGKYVDEVLVHDPQVVSQLNYDVIILASITPVEMKDQLLLLGVQKEKIMFWEQYVSSKSHGFIKKYEIDIERKEKKVLLIVPIINYAGGFLTALYAALALRSKGYYVVIVSPTANHQTISEVNSYGINVWLCPSLPYIEGIELEWIQEFDYVLANSLQNMLCVNRINKIKKTVTWWLHEHSRQYKDIIEQYGNEIDISSFKNVNIFAVSNLARNNFLRYYPNQKVRTLTFGLPDFYNGVNSFHEKIIIAIIGNISQLKNQKELINAVKKLSPYEKDKIECWIIGRDGGKRYREEINEMIKDIQQVKLCGELSRKEIERVFQQIDIVVCSSLEETMSITIVEGMMNNKICITNTNTGIAEFIQNYENGFIYEAENVDDLLLKLKYVIQNFDSLDFMRKKARKTYEEYFSMESFADNLQEIFEKRLYG